MLQIQDSRHMKRSQQPASLLELFIKSKGLSAGFTSFMETSNKYLSESHWQYTLLPLVTSIGKLV